MASHSEFRRSVFLQATPAEVYAFHQDPRNISRISPPSLAVKSVECRVPAKPGERFRILLSQFGIPLDWTGVWEEAVAPSRLVDGAVASPFRYWRHHHLFAEAPGGTVMTDHVEYALPFGVIGRILDRTVMRVVFAVMFRARHAATKAWFAKAG